MTLSVKLLPGAVFAFLAGACGEEEHGEHEFETRAECEAHYQAEGHTAAEIDELCADVPEDTA